MRNRKKQKIKNEKYKTNDEKQKKNNNNIIIK